MNVSVNSYCDFVKSKLFFDIIKLKGEETHEWCRDIYTQYEDIVSEFTEQVIKNQYASLYRECTAFLESLGVSDHTRIDKAILTHTVMDYFTDIYPDERIPSCETYQRTESTRLWDLLDSAP